MNRIPVHPARVPIVAVAALLAALALAACGSSSPSGKSSSAATTSSTGQTQTGQAGRFAGRFEALRECLEKQGITLPQRVPGGKRPQPGTASPLGGLGGGPRLPKGVTRAQYEAALKKCGGGFQGRLRGFTSSPAFKKSLEKFAACMRQNHVAVPKANTSGKGPIFSTKGINTSSAAFKAAESKCISLLRVARPGAGPGGGPPASPSEGG
jgi:hypothetical protein